MNKILGNWDFYSKGTGNGIGDFIIFLQIINMLREPSYIEEKNIDVCLISEKKKCDGEDYKKDSFWKELFISTININPYIKNIYLFNKRKGHKQFIKQNKKEYLIYPIHKNNTVADMRIITTFYKKKGYIPKLETRQIIQTKIIRFLSKYYKNKKPIIINIRQGTKERARNTNIKEITKFIKHYKNKEEYIFVIICTKQEIPYELRKLKNVIISKDYFEDVEYDLALIENSYLSIFPSGGMSTYAMFTNTPMIMYGEHIDSKYSDSFKKGKFVPLNFLGKHQRMYYGKETSEWLIQEFENLLKYLMEDGKKQVHSV